MRLIEDLDADVIAPGHGPVHNNSPKEAVTSARASAEK
jgi:flavorubredoxin